MSTSKSAPYHHGDLKAALLVAAHALLDEGGVPALTLREVARRAGVSPTATYRHFADKEALLTALAVQGFEAFAEAIRVAGESAHEPFSEMGVAYVVFASRHPGMFRLMFGPAVADRGRSPELLAAIEKSTRLFDRGMKTRSDVQGDERVAGLKSWAMVHGLSMLVLDGMLPGLDPEKLARALINMKVPAG